MLVGTSTLPTPVALVARRLNTAGPAASGDTFLYTSYLAECAIKTVGVAVAAMLLEQDDALGRRAAHTLVSADGLGGWEQVLRTHTNFPLAASLGPDAQHLLAWANARRTKPDDQWFGDACAALHRLFVRLGLPEAFSPGRRACDLVTGLTVLRNKTKAHGAVGQDFFSESNEDYITVVRHLLDTCPVFNWSWYCFRSPGQREDSWLALRGVEPVPHKPVAPEPTETPTAVYFKPTNARRAYACRELLLVNRECSLFRYPNGSLRDSQKADFIDYASGKMWHLPVPLSLAQPVELPRSVTHGAEALDVQTNVFGNLPGLPTSYVERPHLQESLLARLRDRNHPIITLHGRGGVGKTLLANRVAHELAGAAAPDFDFIVWFSARDVDLRLVGPSPVEPAVVDLDAVSRAYGRLFACEGTVDAFARVLQSPVEHSEQGMLFIFDNFESLREPRALQVFLDLHTHLPNKVLITSRERTFQADYPIEVKGMEFPEAEQLMRRTARDLGVEGMVTDEVVRSIYEYCEGHAYVMRLVIGEAAKEGKFVTPRQVLSRRVDIVNSVFERSFGRLTEDGRRVFLTVANWRSAVPELALFLVLGQRGIDVERGLDECVRLSLLVSGDMADGSPYYHAPQLARVFAKKKLHGDPDRLVIQEDLTVLQKFGVLEVGSSGDYASDAQVRRFVDWCFRAVRAGDKSADVVDGLMEHLASLLPIAWRDVALFRAEQHASRESVEAALRRACEENPFNKECWVLRAEHAERWSDDDTRITSLVSAVEADPQDVDLIREVALHLCNYVDKRTAEIPQARRGVYLASVREHMVNVSERLDATGLSRLAWLFLLEGNSDKALQYAREGHDTDPGNVYCEKLLRRLDPDFGASSG
jgi:hypothetical protein